MKHAIFFFLFLALAMTVMSAPTKKPRTICSKANKSSLLAKAQSKKAGGAQSSANKGTHAAAGARGAAAAPAKGSPGKGAPAKKAGIRRELDSYDLEVFGRAGSETTLCGMKIRGSSSRMCQGNHGYFKDKDGHYVWDEWSTFKDSIKSSTVPSKYQCDHALELQLVVKALEDAGFCTAWTQMAEAWKKIDPKKDVKKAMRDEFFAAGSLKDIANSLSMLFYVDTSFNEYKRAWVAAYLRGAPQATSGKLQGYFDAGVVSIVDSVAVAVDHAAYALLDRINSLATPADFDWETATPKVADAVCELDTAQTTTFQAHNKPVQSYWRHMKNLVHAA